MIHIVHNTILYIHTNGVLERGKGRFKRFSWPRCGKFTGHDSLLSLQLSGNELTEAKGLQQMPLLELLQAGVQPFLSLFEALRSEDLGQMGRNKLTNLQGVAQLPCLQALDVSLNQLESLQAPWNEMAGP